MTDATARRQRSMSVGAAAVVVTIDRYGEAGFGTEWAEVQRLAYLLQCAGVPLEVEFVKGCYSPYSDGLHTLIAKIDGCSLLRSRTQPSVSLFDAATFAVRAAKEVLANEQSARKSIDDVLALVDGFESTYGLELLSGVHWLVAEERCTDRPEIFDAIDGWAPRPARLFTRHHVATAIDKLVDCGWISGEMFGAAGQNPVCICPPSGDHTAESTGATYAESDARRSTPWDERPGHNNHADGRSARHAPMQPDGRETTRPTHGRS